MTLKIKETRSMSEEDLNDKLGELKKELVKHNAQIATGTTPKNPGMVNATKKTIARILTIIKEKSDKNGLKEEKKKHG